jgi:glucokinase
MFLAGDIGGTRSRFYAIDKEKIVFEHIYSSKDYSDFPSIVEDFVKKSGLSFTLCVFGIAGVVIDGRCKTTNLPWEVSIHEIKQAAQCPEGYLMNDLTLLSYGTCQLKESGFQTMQEGEKKAGPMLVVCPGTGLGVSCITSIAFPLEILPTEAGHIDFAPSDDLELELLKYFYKTYEHVSIERFVSGSGIPNIYKFLCKKHEKDALFTTSEDITEAALKGEDKMAKDTILLFLDLFASTLGNLALIYLPFHGVYICGSLIRRLYPLLDKQRFFKRFASKGRFSSMLTKVPVYLVKEEKLAPLGAIAFIKNIKEKKHAH